jgi:hypothetical protein
VIPRPDLPLPLDDFVGRKPQIDAFRQALQQGLIAGRTSSFAILGDKGIGKSSLLLQLSALCSEPTFAMLPVSVPASNDIHDYLRFAEIQPYQLETIWPAIFDQLGREKFQSDISQLRSKELDFTRRLASLGAGEFRARQFAGKFQREYFARLLEKRLLIRTRRGRYKLYQPLFREFLRQTK